MDIDKLNAVTDTWQRKGISTSELVEAMEHDYNPECSCENCMAEKYAMNQENAVGQ